MIARVAVSILLLVSVALSSSVGLLRQAGASEINGVVKDPAGAVVAGARITATAENGDAATATTDDQGRFKIDNLKPGRYTVAVEAKGFKRTEQSTVVETGRKPVLEIKLDIAAPAAEITVRGKGGLPPNTDPGYREVRGLDPIESYTVNNLTLKRDVGTITLRSGTISFSAPMMGRVVKGVFIGDGQFAMKPAIDLETAHLRLITDKDTVDELFDRAVFCFTDQTYDEVKRSAAPGAVDARARDVLSDFNNRVRRRTERPRSFVEALLTEGENLDAELLTDLYNPKRAGCFNAYIFGKKYNDLRFLIRPRGALPQILSPEEVALINVDTGADREGIWYLAHFETEYKNATASSEEDKRVIDVQHYKIETIVGGDSKLTAVAEITFKAVGDGDRIVALGLLPNLRVSRVLANEQDQHFIQESRNSDGSFYLVMPEPMAKDKPYKVVVEYRGDKILEDAGGGNFAVGARTSWYPSANAFNDRATFDLTFKVPKQYTLVGVGNLVKESKEGDFAVSQWVSEVPLAVAGFNYGSFKKKSVTDASTKYVIEGYATSELPSYLRDVPSMGSDDLSGGGTSVTPSRLTDKGIAEAQNSMRLFSSYFGEAPYGRIAITQQPQPNFGQSWPTLVYLPILAFFDSTQRYMLLGQINRGLTEFIDEVTSHEVAHQWWGHMVGWASYHDQWLSEGFATFSAGLFLQATQKSEKYLNYYANLRKQVLDKNRYGKRANDAGPLWMGLRLNTYKTPGAYGGIVYPKGAYVLNMLRSIMWNTKTGDQRFKEMMHDFVKSHLHQNASTESFKRVVEKHMTEGMDLDGNKKMDWFFNQWVYGTEVPSYKLVYSLKPEPDGKTLLTATVTQSGVSDKFKMLVPVYLDFDGKIMRLGEATITGNSTTPEFKIKLPQKPKRVVINYYNDLLAYETLSVPQN